MHGSVLVYKKDNKQNIFLDLRETGYGTVTGCV